MMKNIFIALIAGIIFVLSVMLLALFVQYILTVYMKIKDRTNFNVTLHHGGLSIIIGILIAIEIYLITM